LRMKVLYAGRASIDRSVTKAIPTISSTIVKPSARPVRAQFMAS
jgi:hypothetical protein